MFGGTERITGNSFLVEVEKRDAATLLPIIQHHIRPGSVIYCDEWRAYCRLGGMGYTHKTVNNSQNFVDPNMCSHPTGGEYVVVMQTHDAGNKNNAFYSI